MTKQELLDLIDLEKGRRRRGNGRFLKVGVLITLLVLFVQISGALVKPMDAYAAMFQDFFASPPVSEEKKTVRFNVGYSKSEGVVVQKLKETPVKITVDGAEVITRTILPPVDDILQDAGVELGENDRAEARIATNSGEIPEIRVTRVLTRIETEEEEIPFSVERVADQSLPAGSTEIRQPGEKGVRLKKYEVTAENGSVIRRQKLGSEVIREPVAQVVALGGNSGQERQVAARGVSLEGRRVMEMTATAYTHTGNPTASGVMPYVGGVAVDPQVIPLGTELFVEGYGYGRAVDTGGLIKGNRIDVFLDTTKECYDWGRRKVRVYIME